MNSEEARKILELYRLENPDAADPQVAEALEFMRDDPELRRWFEQSCAFHAALREKFKAIPVPAGLKEAIVARNNIIYPAWWQKPVWFAAAAVLVLFFSLAILWVQPRAKDRFSDYRARMVRTALRQYRMEIVTNDLNEVRRFLEQRGAPSDYALPPGLEKLALTGGASLKWRGNPVSMVCFDRGDRQMLFLFVMDRSAVKDAPRSGPEYDGLRNDRRYEPLCQRICLMVEVRVDLVHVVDR